MSVTAANSIHSFTPERRACRGAHQRQRNMKALPVLLAISVLAGCDRAPASPKPAQAVLQHRSHLDQRTLRVRIDAMRNRAWVLAADHVDVYDRQNWGLIRRIELPAWVVADFVCAPDVAFDPSGIAFVSHNLEAKLWQIDPDTFELKHHVIRLVNRDHLDIGFGGLVFAPDCTLFGAASTGGSLWRIDVAGASAYEVNVDAPGMDECTGKSPLRNAEDEETRP